MTIVRSAVLECSYIALSILVLTEVFSNFRFIGWLRSMIKNKAVLLFSILGAVPPLFLIHYYLVGGYKKIDPILKSSVTDWSSVGSMAAGCFTGMAAFFTLATLLYTKRQNDELREDRKIELQLVTLESYSKHKQQFREYITDVLSWYQDPFFSVTLESSDKLYANIFRQNSIRNVVFEMTEEEFLKNNFFAQVERGLNSLSEKGKKYTMRHPRSRGDFSSIEPDSFILHGIGLLFNFLSMESPRAEMSTMNIIQAYNTINQIESIYNSIRQFVGLRPSNRDFSFLRNPHYIYRQITHQENLNAGGLDYNFFISEKATSTLKFDDLNVVKTQVECLVMLHTVSCNTPYQRWAKSPLSFASSATDYYDSLLAGIVCPLTKNTKTFSEDVLKVINGFSEGIEKLRLELPEREAVQLETTRKGVEDCLYLFQNGTKPPHHTAHS